MALFVDQTAGNDDGVTSDALNPDHTLWVERVVKGDDVIQTIGCGIVIRADLADGLGLIYAAPHQEACQTPPRFEFPRILVGPSISLVVKTGMGHPFVTS